jgi:hypothetical protein
MTKTTPYRSAPHHLLPRIAKTIGKLYLHHRIEHPKDTYDDIVTDAGIESIKLDGTVFTVDCEDLYCWDRCIDGKLDNVRVQLKGTPDLVVTAAEVASRVPVDCCATRIVEDTGRGGKRVHFVNI